MWYRGVVARTTDNGRTWRSWCTSGGSIAAAAFADASNGWVLVVSRGPLTLMRTTNGGETWAMVNDDVPLAGARQLVFLDALRGWAVGHVGSETETTSVVLRTIDGGVTWTGTRFTGASIISAAFADGVHGVAVGSDGSGGVAYATDDGGARWKRTQLPNARQLTAVTTGESSDSLWWATADPAGQSEAIYSSADHGATWVPRAASDHSRLLDVTASGKRLFAAGGGPVGPLGSEMWRSVDAGETWTVRGLTHVFRMTNDAYVYQSVSAAGDEAWSVSSLGDVIRTGDGGETWASASNFEYPIGSGYVDPVHLTPEGRCLDQSLGD